MDWNISYFVLHSLVTIFTMGCIHAHLYVNKSISPEIRNKFLALTNILVVEALEDYADKTLALVPDGRYNFLRLTVSSIGYTVRPLMLYVVLLIMMRNIKWKGKEIILAIPTIITFLITLLSYFTEWVIYYDENNFYHSGPLHYVIFAMLALYFVLILLVNVINGKKNGTEKRTIFGIIALLAMDWVLALKFNIIDLHGELESLSVILYFMYFLSVVHAEKIVEKDNELVENEQRMTKEMLDQAIETLAYTIDAKDKYTKGHSSRVAKYARMIASVSGKTEEECREVYLAGLLHDIGKISITGAIINKPGKLDEEEFASISQHPVYGAKILEKMKSIPYLQDGALYHHERYDGTGYPKGLKGTEIPELARIIAVADAYDAMTSCRSYRLTMDQIVVKQEIWKGMGTQFDPLFAKVMISLIDADVTYEMREIPGKQDEIVFDNVKPNVEWNYLPKEQAAETKMLQKTNSSNLAAFICSQNHWCDPSEGFELSPVHRKICFQSVTSATVVTLWSAPVVLVYSSNNGKLLGPDYDELGVFMSAGYGWRAGSAEYEISGFTRQEAFLDWDNWLTQNKAGMTYTVEAFQKDKMVYLTIRNELLVVDARVSLPDNYSRKIHIAISGENSQISDVKEILT